MTPENVGETVGANAMVGDVAPERIQSYVKDMTCSVRMARKYVRGFFLPMLDFVRALAHLHATMQ